MLKKLYILQKNKNVSIPLNVHNYIYASFIHLTDEKDIVNVSETVILDMRTTVKQI